MVFERLYIMFMKKILKRTLEKLAPPTHRQHLPRHRDSRSRHYRGRRQFLLCLDRVHRTDDDHRRCLCAVGSYLLSGLLVCTWHENHNLS